MEYGGVIQVTKNLLLYESSNKLLKRIGKYFKDMCVCNLTVGEAVKLLHFSSANLKTF